jgi:aspartyl protease family protein
MAITASGTAPMMTIRLKSVSIGQLTVRNVPAGVLPGSYPDVPLLGTSFLKNFDMERRGNQLDLIKRY